VREFYALTFEDRKRLQKHFCRQFIAALIDLVRFNPRVFCLQFRAVVLRTRDPLAKTHGAGEPHCDGGSKAEHALAV
jgi:hypothetical protein